MKKALSSYLLTAIYLLVLFSPIGCRDLTVVEGSYQRLLINDFSAPLRTSLPPYQGTPTSLTLLINGTISKPVIVAIDQLGGSQGSYAIRRDTLMAGTYTDKRFRGDHYSNQAIEMIVTGADSAVGNLTIEWYRQ